MFADRTRQAHDTHGRPNDAPRARAARSPPAWYSNAEESLPVDLATEIDIARPRLEVAAYASDPDHVTDWYENIIAVDWLTPRPLAVGTRLAFVASFLRRGLEYTYEVRAHVPGEQFVMSTAEGGVSSRWRRRTRGRTSPAAPRA